MCLWWASHFTLHTLRAIFICCALHLYFHSFCILFICLLIWLSYQEMDQCHCNVNCLWCWLVWLRDVVIFQPPANHTSSQGRSSWWRALPQSSCNVSCHVPPATRLHSLLEANICRPDEINHILECANIVKQYMQDSILLLYDHMLYHSLI